jgi:glycosyltransferase involved in cell wall biosynthesis
MIKFSIIIPTADRHYLLQHALRSCLAIPRDDIEVIVSDNHSSPETKAVVDAHRQDSRLKYVRTDRRMPMPDHWDFAWAKASGQFVIINCDDDAISASGLRAIERAIDNLDAQIISWPVALYLHPDYEAEGGPNAVIFPSGHSNLYLLLDTPGVIAAYARFDFRYFPQGTHFCIAKELGESILGATGRLFWTPAPDFTAPLLALAAAENGRYCYIDSILGFGGRSKRSNAAAFSQGAKPEDGKTIQQFHSEFGEQDTYPHHPLKANFYCNYHFAGNSLLKKFYPQFASVEVDEEKFFRLAYEELFRVRPNPLLDDKEKKLFDLYIDSLDESRRNLAMRARHEVLERRSWRTFRTRDEVIRAFTPQILKVGVERMLTALGLYRRTAAVIRLPGAEHGFKDAFDVFSNWDRLVLQHDLVSLANLNEAFVDRLILSAHNLGSHTVP